MSNEYRHFYIRDENNHPITLVSWTRFKDGNVILYAFATHRPGEPFSRAEARKWGDRRLRSIVTSAEHGIFRGGSVINTSDPDWANCTDVEAIEVDMARRGRTDVPTRVKRLLRQPNYTY